MKLTLTRLLSLGLLTLIGINILLSVMYAVTPITALQVRNLISIIELACMVITMGVAMRWLLESF